MLSLTRFLQQQAEAQNDGECDTQVEQLVQRVSEAVLIGDRREALQHLRDLLASSAKAQLAFGAVGFPAMLQVVREREDLEMVQLALESLAAAVGGGGSGAGDASGGQAAAINAQQLVRTPEGLPLLLSLLGQEPAGLGDFYARYHTLQVLKGLVATAPHQLQEAILGAPLGVTRLMDLLGEQEVLRNEALLLLTQLAGGNGDLQKIAVFEGAFERLFGIVREEGLLDGDIVVHDCFQLMAALLRGSPPNQLMFRETGFLAQLPPLLRLPERSGAGEGDDFEKLPPGKAANLVAALEVVLALLPQPAAAPGATVCSSQAENRQALLQRGLLDVLVALALQGGGAPDSAVRAQALLCLAALVGGSRTQQDQLAALSVKSVGGEAVPLLQAVLQAAVAADSGAEQVAADRLLESYCCGNSAGQSVLAGSLLHSAAAAPGSFGGYLLLSLGRQGSLPELAASSRAAAALSHLISGSPGIQLHLLALQVQQRQQQKAAAGGSGGSSSLMAVCASHLGLLATQHGRQPGSVQAVADTLRLLLLWLHACPPAVTAFLRAVAQSQPFLVDSIRGSNACSSSASSAHPLTRGMLALLLGLCASYAEDATGTPSQQQLVDAIGKQIGQQQYVAILDAMLQHAAATEGSSSAGSSSSSSGGPAEGPSASPAFAAFLSTLAAEVRQRVTGSSGPQLPPAAQQYQSAGHAPSPSPSHAPPPAASAAPMNGSARSPAAWAAPQAAAAAPLPAPAAMQTTPPRASASPRQPGSTAGAATAASYAAPQPPLGSQASATPELRQALATVDAQQRENQQLRAEHGALSERLRLSSSGSGANGSAHGQSPELAAAQQAAAAAAQQLQEVEAEVQRAREDAQAARTAARKLEMDLEDLSAAYGTLDAHAGSLQQQVEQLQLELAAERRRQQQQGAQAPAGGSSSGDVGGIGEAEVQRQVEAARQEAQQEADDAMGDLLVCLGQEEAKVARLRQRLEAQGVDCDALLADIVDAVGEEEDMT